MKKYLPLMILVMSLCLEGCNGKQKEDSVPNLIHSDENMQEIDAKKEPEMTETFEPVCFSLDDIDKKNILIDTPEFTLLFNVHRDLDYGFYKYGYEAIGKRSEKEIYTIELSKLYINETEYIGSDNIYGSYINSGVHESARINDYIYVNDVNSITSISGVANVSFCEGTYDDEQYEFDIKVDSDSSWCYELCPYMDAMAVTQNIINNDIWDVQLIGLGNFNGENGPFKCIFRIVNKTVEDQIFAINTVVLNNICFECLQDAAVTVKAGKEYYYEYKLANYDIDKTGITSISSVKFLILTGELENTAIRGECPMGGQLYEVNLYKRGNEVEKEPDGELLYDDNSVNVYLTGQKTDIDSIYPSLYCYITVENRTDNNISFDYSDTRINGASCEQGRISVWKYDMSYSNDDMIANVIPPGCCYNGTIILKGTDAIKLPCTASFKLDFYTAGGGELICQSDEISIDYTE